MIQMAKQYDRKETRVVYHQRCNVDESGVCGSWSATPGFKHLRRAPKNSNARSFAVAPVVMDALKKEKEKQDHYRSVLGEKWSNPHNLVFTTEFGKNLVKRTVVKHYKKVLERAKLPDNRFHDLRHSFAVNSLQAGDNIKNVQANLGHATSAFTMDVYCHVSKSMNRESAARTQAFYESVKPV